MRAPVTSKADMYQRLARGEFGNTIPQYFSVDAWRASGDDKRYSYWGVRSATVAGHPKCKMYVPTPEVAEYAAEHFPGTANISCMVDAFATVLAWLEVWQSPTGLRVEGIELPKTTEGWNWRNSMPNPERRKGWGGTAARQVLKKNLNPNSYDDLQELLDEYPDHVVELSALDTVFGTCPGRNGIVWEARAY